MKLSVFKNRLNAIYEDLSTLYNEANLNNTSMPLPTGFADRMTTVTDDLGDLVYELQD